MSDEDPKDPQPEPIEDAPEAPETEAGREPEEEPFDAERAKAKIHKANSEAANLRRKLKELEPLAAKARELEDANKTELEKLTERVTAAEREAGETGLSAMRLEVALDKAPDGVSLAQIRKLAKRLSGSTREDLEADAEELFGDLVPASGGKPPTQRPKEALKGGADPETEPEKDPADLAAAVLKRRRGY